MVYRIGSCEIDALLYELRSSGRVVPLMPRAFDLLVYLIRHRGRVVSANELAQQVWGGIRVSGSTVRTCVKGVRDALQLCGVDPRVIRTVHARGYHWTLPVEALASPECSSHWGDHWGSA